MMCNMCCRLALGDLDVRSITCKSIPSRFAKFCYFTSSKTHFSNLPINFYITSLIPFFILQHVLLKYNKTIHFLYIGKQPTTTAQYTTTTAQYTLKPQVTTKPMAQTPPPSPIPPNPRHKTPPPSPIPPNPRHKHHHHLPSHQFRKFH